MQRTASIVAFCLSPPSFQLFLPTSFWLSVHHLWDLEEPGDMEMAALGVIENAIYIYQMASLINRENMWKSWYTSETWMTGAFTLLGRCRQILVFLGKKMQLLHQKFGVGLSRIQKRWKILQKHQNHHIKVLSLGILQQNRSKVIASARDQRLGRNCSRLRLETYERVARDGSGDWKMVVSWRLVWIIIYQMLIQDTLW